MPPSADPFHAARAVTPVILCGGAGTRLWPVSTPERPKPFAPLVDERSGFQDALARARLVARGSKTIVVGALGARALIEAETELCDLAVEVLLEPQGRGSAAAMAAAAELAARTDPDTVLVVLSADHHVDNLEAFTQAVDAAVEAAVAGAVVTLGVHPTAPLTGFGYIRPGAAAGEAKPVLAFVEKPDPAMAALYLSEGYLWNSGMFIVTARTLLAELERFAPRVLRQAREALTGGRRDAAALRLGPAFLDAPNTSIDYAVMERTALAQVVPARFGWADIGAWDAVWQASGKDELGNVAPADAVLLDTANVLAHAGPGVRLGLIGVRDVAVVATSEATLVCALEQSQAVRTVAERMAANPRRVFATVEEASAWFDLWMRTSALPLWWALGADHDRGGFQEAITQAGRPIGERRRLRVQARQVFVYASAGLEGWSGPWREAVEHGLDYILRHYARPDGLYSGWYEPETGAMSESAPTYEQAFVLLSLSAACAAGVRTEEAIERAGALGEALACRAQASAAYGEVGEHPFQANANMHVFEALLAWTALDPARWGDRADALGVFALSHFFDPDRGLLREYYDAEWRGHAGELGGVVEPGHQYEWAFLFGQWADLRGVPEARRAAEVLAETAGRGVDPARGVAMNRLRDDFSILDPRARLWPQTERLKAARVFGQCEPALDALGAIRAYLNTPVAGLWRDKLLVSGAFVEEPAPATSLYHLVGAWRALRAG